MLSICDGAQSAADGDGRTGRQALGVGFGELQHRVLGGADPAEQHSVGASAVEDAGEGAHGAWHVGESLDGRS
ncbi:hypothetical protein ACIPD2_15115 [Streptomyces griseofuscus]|uniref:hypothetical protein n=1 Tax=Streptomyces griseofuscus TaxID=146922 RepID=UPI0037FF31ED